MYDVTVKKLKINQTLNIFPASHYLINESRNIIKETERQLIAKVLEQNWKNLTIQLNNSESNIAVYLKGLDLDLQLYLPLVLTKSKC